MSELHLRALTENLKSSFDSQPLYIGRGCEGTCWKGSICGRAVRVKQYRRLSELKRFVVASVLLDKTIEEHGWSDFIRVPPILEVSIESVIVVSEYVHGSSQDQFPNGGIARPAAEIALMCAAAIVANMSDEVVDSHFRSSEFTEVATRPYAPFCGVDASGDNLLFDGAQWWAVDL